MIIFCHVLNTISGEKLYDSLPDGSSPRDYMEFNGIKEFSLPTVCSIVTEKGQPIFLKKEEWHDPIPDDYSCVFVSYPKLGPDVAAGIALASLIISVATTVYFLATMPDIPESQNIQDTSPTYALTGLKNKKRLDQPVPVQYGEIRAYPDIASDFFVTHPSADPATYSVTYAGNGNTGGSVPTDSINYNEDEVAIIIGNTGALVKTGETFTGWDASVVPALDRLYAERTMIVTEDITMTANWTTDTTYTVTYDGNGSTGGSVPTDADTYLAGGYAHVRDNTGVLTLASNDFKEWNTVPGGSGDAWLAGEKFVLGAANVTLYAQWELSFQLSAITYDGNGASSGSVPVDTNNYLLNNIALIRRNEGLLRKTGLTFSGWRDSNGIAFLPDSTILMTGSDLTLTAKWSSSPSVLAGRLCVGHGDFEATVDDIRLDDTEFSVFKAQNIKILSTGDTPEIFLYDVATAKETGNVVLEDDQYIGPFIASDANFVTGEIVVDYEFKRGLYTSDSSGVLTNKSVSFNMSIQQVDANGVAFGATTVIGPSTATAATRDVVRGRVSSGILATPGRYEVQFKRTNLPSTNAKIIDDVTVVRMKAVRSTLIPVNSNYTFVEFDIEASNQLNNSNSDIMNIKATRKIDTYDAVGVLTQLDPSSSPVWAFYDMALNGVYGCGLDTNRADLGSLIELDQHLQTLQQLDEPAIECNVRFDTAISGFDCLTQIAQSARCNVYQRAGKVWMVRDEFKQSVTAFFTADNIDGPPNVSWTPRSQFSPKYFEISYFDEITNQLETVNAVWPGETINSTDKKESIKIFAITNRTKAWQEGMFYLAQDRLRRKVVKFTTDVEGYIPSMFDKISLTHENLSDEISGTVQRIDGSVVYLSEPVAFDGAMTGQIAFKDLDGTLQGPFTVTQGGNQYNVRLVDWNPANANIISQEDESVNEATRFTFGIAVQSVVGMVKITSPSSDNKVNIEMVVDDGRVHANDWDSSLIPPIGTSYIASDEKIFSDVTTTTDISTPTAPSVTTTWEGQGYLQYVLEYTYIVAGVSTVDTVLHNEGVPNTQTYNYLPTHGEEVPVKCIITPQPISFASPKLLTPLRTNSPLYVTE